MKSFQSNFIVTIFSITFPTCLSYSTKVLFLGNMIKVLLVINYVKLYLFHNLCLVRIYTLIKIDDINKKILPIYESLSSCLYFYSVNIYSHITQFQAKEYKATHKVVTSLDTTFWCWFIQLEGNKISVNNHS